MDAILSDIIVAGKGSTTSIEVRDATLAIAPRGKISHKEVGTHVAKNLLEVKIAKIRGGGGKKYPKFRLDEMRLASALEVAKKAELLLRSGLGGVGGPNRAPEVGSERRPA